MPSSIILSSSILSELDERQLQGDWSALLTRIEGLREEFGAVPELLFRSGFASAQLEDFARAQRLMADALLAEFNPEWLPWLAAVYDKLNWSLPMWAIAKWLQVNQAEREGVNALYGRALRQISRELEVRNLAIPPLPVPPIDEAMAHKYNVRMVELLQSGEGDAAIAVGEGARLFYPNYLPLLVNLSIAYKRLNLTEQSARICLYSLAIDPLGGGVISNFGSTLLAAAAAHDACRLLEAGAILFRDDASIWCNLAVAYNNMQVAAWEGELAARRAIEIDPKMAAAWSALAGALCKQGRVEESLEAAKIVGQIDPQRKNESLFNLNYSGSLAPAEIAMAHFEAAEARYGHLYREQKFLNNLDFNRRLKVGFVSGDLVGHPVSYFMDPVFEYLPEFCDVLIYHNRPISGEDQVSEIIKSYDLTWKNVALLSNEALHELILEDKIDVLVDLSGHTAYHRLPIFAMRSAPVQVTYMGYPNTTGLKTMDYYLSHRTFSDNGIERLFSEKWHTFDRTSCVYRPLIKNRSLINDVKFNVQDTPSLKNGYITFGTLNNIAKVSENVIEVWSELLKKVDGSKIFIESPGLHQKDFRRQFKEKFEKFGISTDRVLLHSRDVSLQYVRWNEIDIALDPFPYCGGTTSMDALWMGVPLVSLYGERLMSRAGLSTLTILGRAEWACSTAEEYIKCAALLASDVQKLNRLRQGLRGEMERSPLMDYPGFAKDMSEAFGAMWRSYVVLKGAA